MERSKIDQLIELINELVAEHEPWEGKARAIRSACTKRELENIEEFASWFEV